MRKENEEKITQKTDFCVENLNKIIGKNHGDNLTSFRSLTQPTVFFPQSYFLNT